MNNEYCIYFGERQFWIVPMLTDKLNELKDHPATLILDEPDKDSIGKSILLLDTDQAEAVIIIAGNTERCWNIFKKQFKFIQAGGGFVKNENDEYLFIFRRGKWDLPKGKLDDGETIETCALREVNEETGLQNIILLNHLCNTWHAYHEKEEFVLKESVWFNMECSGHQELTPQTEEDIFDIRWLKSDQWQMIFENTFPSIKDVLSRVRAYKV